MNGFNSAEPGPALERQLVHLQVRGRNQLLKEIVETHAMPDQQMDLKALHRNEMTKESEEIKDDLIEGGKSIDEIIVEQFDTKALFF